MKLKLIKIASLLMVSGTLMTSAVFAETSDKVKVSYTTLTGEVVLQGTNVTPGGKLTIEILNVGAETPISDDDVRYLTECTADSNGEWRKSFIFDSDSGKYPVRVYIADDNKIYEETLDFVSMSQLNEIVEQINANPSQLEKLVRENVDLLGIKSKAYEIAEQNNLLEAGFDICKNDIPFEDVIDFQNSLKCGMTIAVFNHVNDAKSLYEVVDDSMDVLYTSDERVYTDWKDLSASQKSAVCQNMKKSGYKNADDIRYDWVESLALQEFKDVTEWNGIVKIAQEYADIYKEKINALSKIDFSAYNALSGERRYQAMMELKKSYGNITTLEAWKDKFNELCAKWKTASLPNNNGGGGGGGGSSSSGKGTTSGGIIAVTPDNGNNSKENNEMFNDLGNAPWAKEAIESLAKRGVVSGKGTGAFDTQSNVTREEFVKMLTGALGLTADNGYECSFTDADKEQWYYKYVACAEQYGITEGTGNGEFGIGKYITREEMAAMIVRAASVNGIELKEKVDPTEFTDYNEISEWAKDACTILQKAGIINGMEDGRFAPHENATRAQTAVMIYKML